MCMWGGGKGGGEWTATAFRPCRPEPYVGGPGQRVLLTAEVCGVHCGRETQRV